jgi:hypothetical protein
VGAITAEYELDSNVEGDEEAACPTMFASRAGADVEATATRDAEQWRIQPGK